MSFSEICLGGQLTTSMSMSESTMPQAPKTLNQFAALKQVIADLRGPDGCPWDKEQTHQSLTPYAIEETHEMVEAIESQNDEHMCEELGDVLFQVVLHAQLAEERQAFTLEDVIESIVSKIVRRHPHVFGEAKVSGTEEVLQNWEEIKKLEKKNKSSVKPALDVPEQLPALQRAGKIGEKTARMGFDWTQASEVLAQLKSEISELEQAIQEKNQSSIHHEMGDVIFSAAQLARHLEAEPETALRATNRRFINRFEFMVKQAGSIENFSRLLPGDKEKLWSNAKKAEKSVS